MTKPLQNKTALITGAPRGIGRAIALRLAELGASIAVNFVRNEEAAQESVRALNRHGIRAIPFQANVGDPEAVNTLVEQVMKEFGRIDILIHNAAIGSFKPVFQLKMNQWDLSVDINAKAFLNLTQKVAPIMEKNGSGSIIAISSLGARRFIPDYGAIGISKAALEALVKYLAVELAPKNIRVNCVSGGPVETDALKLFPKYRQLAQEVVAKTPAGRIGQPDDLARVVAFLVSPESEWIYGQTIIADGGLSLV